MGFEYVDEPVDITQPGIYADKDGDLLLVDHSGNGIRIYAHSGDRADWQNYQKPSLLGLRWERVAIRLVRL